MRFMRNKTSFSAINDQDKVMRETNPLDAVEFLAELHHLEFQRPENNEIYFIFHQGELFFEEGLQWLPNIETLSYYCSFAIDVPQERQRNMVDLVSRLNAHLLTGHFDYIPGHEQVHFRYGLILQGGADLSNKQCETLLNMGPKICLRHFETFTLVAKSDIDAKMAIRLTLLDTVGEA